MEKQKILALMKKVEIYEAVGKFLIDVLVEVISGVILKLISGSTAGPQREPELA